MKYKIENFYGKNMVKIETNFKKGIFKTKIRDVFSKDFKAYNLKSKTGMTRPALNCDFIIDGFSISKNSVFELSNVLKLGYNFLSYGEVTYTTYCLPENCEEVEIIQIKLIKENIKEYKRYLNKELYNLLIF